MLLLRGISHEYILQLFGSCKYDHLKYSTKQYFDVTMGVYNYVTLTNIHIQSDVINWYNHYNSISLHQSLTCTSCSTNCMYGCVFCQTFATILCTTLVLSIDYILQSNPYVCIWIADGPEKKTMWKWFLISEITFSYEFSFNFRCFDMLHMAIVITFLIRSKQLNRLTNLC